MNNFTKSDGPMLVRNGKPMAKKRNPVYLIRQEAMFSVETNEGILTGKPGDYLAHDPMSGHVWPVAADYVAVHYEAF